MGQQGGIFYFIVLSTKINVLEYPLTLRFWIDRYSRDQPQPGSLFQLLREAEKREPGNERERERERESERARGMGTFVTLKRHFSNLNREL